MFGEDLVLCVYVRACVFMRQGLGAEQELQKQINISLLTCEEPFEYNAFLCFRPQCQGFTAPERPLSFLHMDKKQDISLEMKEINVCMAAKPISPLPSSPC